LRGKQIAANQMIPLIRLKNMIATEQKVYATWNKQRITINNVLLSEIFFSIHGSSIFNQLHHTTIDHLSDISYDIVPNKYQPFGRSYLS
jgi:hypothetical protein